MQLICEAYFMLKEAARPHRTTSCTTSSTSGTAASCDSYLIEITRDIFSVKDAETGEYLVDKILDTAGAKGTGKWMSQLALDLGVPSTLVTEAVYARCLSALEGRPRAGQQGAARARRRKYAGDRKAFIEQIRQALYASKICSYAQGFVQLQAAATEHNWPLNYGDCRPAVARRLHHPRRVPRPHQGSVRRRIRSSRTCCSLRTSRKAVARRPGRLAARGRRPPRSSAFRSPAFSARPRLLRRLPPRPPAGQPAAGPARLLRRPHLRAHRQAAGIVPHRVDPRTPPAEVDARLAVFLPPSAFRLRAFATAHVCRLPAQTLWPRRPGRRRDRRHRRAGRRAVRRPRPGRGARRRRRPQRRTRQRTRRGDQEARRHGELSPRSTPPIATSVQVAARLRSSSSTAASHAARQLRRRQLADAAIRHHRRRVRPHHLGQPARARTSAARFSARTWSTRAAARSSTSAA